MELWIVLLVYIMVAMVCFEIRSVAGKLNHTESREVVGYAITVTQCLAAKGALYVSRCGNA